MIAATPNGSHKTARSRRHGGRIIKFARKWGCEPDSVIDFSANAGSMGPSPKAREAASEALKRVSLYPEDDGRLENALAIYLGVGPDNILTGNGSAELIYRIVNHFQARRVVVAAPAFTEYAGAAESAGAAVVAAAPRSDLKLDLTAVADAAGGSDLIFLGNPNNPTGELIDAAKIMELRRIEPQAVIVVDEAFMDFLPLPEKHSLRHHACRDNRLVVLGSLGKFFALAGLRIGYMIGESNLLEDIAYRRPPWMVNNIASSSAAVSVSDNDFIEAVRTETIERRRELSLGLDEIQSLNTYESHANFLLVRIADRKLTAVQLQERLSSKRLLIRTVDDYDFLDSYHFRIAVRGRRENAYLIDSIKEVLQ